MEDLSEGAHEILQILKSLDATSGKSQGEDALTCYNEIQQNYSNIALPLLEIAANVPQYSFYALTTLKNAVEKSFDPESKELNNRVLEILTGMVIKREPSNPGVCIALLSLCSKDVPWDKAFILIIESDVPFSTKLMFVEATFTKKRFDLILENTELLIKCVMDGFNSDYSTSVKALSLLFVLCNMDPTLTFAIQSRSNEILNLCKESDFESVELWQAFGSILFETDDLVDLGKAFIQIVKQLIAKGTNDYAATQLVQGAVLPFYRQITPADLAFFYQTSFKAAATALTLSDSPFDLLNFFERTVDIFDHELCYLIFKAMADEAETSEEMIVVLLIAALWLTTLQKQITEDWPFYEKLIKEALAANEEGAFAACDFLMSLNEDYADFIVDENFFLESLVPLFKNQSVEIQTHAFKAISSLFNVVPQKITGFFQTVWSISQMIGNNQIGNYLQLLSRAIELDRNFDFEEIPKMVDFIANFLNESAQEDIASGAIIFACTLYRRDECCHGSLTNSLLSFAQRYLDSVDNQTVQAVHQALITLSVFQEIPNEFITRLIKNLGNPQFKMHAQAISETLVKIYIGHPFPEDLCNEFSNELMSVFEHIPIHIFAPILPSEVLQARIHKKCEKVKGCSMREAVPNKVSNLNVLGEEYLRYIPQTSIEEVVELSRLFTQGQLKFQKGERPVKSNAAFKEFINLISNFNSENSHFLLEYAQLLIESKDIDVVDAGLNVLCVFIESNCLMPEDVPAIIAIIESQLDREIDDTIAQNLIYLVWKASSCNPIIADTVSNYLDLFALYLGIDDDSIVNNTISLILYFAFNHYRNTHLLDLALSRFPTDDLSDIVDQCLELNFGLEKLAEENEGHFVEKVTLAIARVFCLPRAQLLEMPEDLTNDLVAKVRNVMSQSESVQSQINQLIANKPIAKARFMNALGLDT